MIKIELISLIYETVYHSIINIMYCYQSLVSVSSAFDDECGIRMFGSYEPHVSKLNKGMQLLLCMQELDLIKYDSEIQQLRFTTPGLNHLMNGCHQMKMFINRYDLQAEDFGIPSEQMSGLLQTINDSDQTVNELGETVDDYNEMEFNKAPGEQMI
jgi:hypothetical protein